MNVRASYHQERLYFADHFETGLVYDGHPTYHNYPLIVEIIGPLKANFLEASLQKLVLNHEALRTNLVLIDGVLFQKLSTSLSVALGHITALNRKRAFEMADEYSSESFLLDSDPLIRARLINFGNSQNLLVLVFHHACVDRESVKLLLKQLVELYASQTSYLKSVFRKPRVQYADISEWQRNSMEEIYASQIEFWKNRMRYGNVDLNFPGIGTRRSVHVFRASEDNFVIEQTCHRLVMQWCDGNRIEVETFYMAVFIILLSKFCSQKEVTIGSVYSLRNTVKESKDVVGPLENLYAVMTQVSGGLIFKDFVIELEVLLRQSKINSVVPFDRLISELNLEKDMSRTALFDVLFRYDASQNFYSTSNSTTFIHHEKNIGWGKYDLNLLLSPDNSGKINGALTFNSLYFDTAVIGQFIHSYFLLTNAVLAKPFTPIAKLSLTEEATDSKKYVEGNSGGFEEQDTVSSIFTRCAHADPGAVCIVFKDHHFTYDFVEDMSDRLASMLVSQNGVEAGTYVGLLLERSEWMIISMLGILKAGGIYIPIDPLYPQTRINDIISHSGLGKVIVTSLDKDKFNFDLDVELIEVPFDNYFGQDFASRPTMGRDGMYILFTSGTTGIPKGCVVSHENVLNLILNPEMPLVFGKSDVWIMIHSFSFDFSVWEIYAAILTGGKLIIPPSEVVHDVHRLLDVIRKSNVTVLNQTPLLFNLVVDIESLSEKRSLDSHLRYIVFGGDKLTSSPILMWKKLYPQNRVKLVNMYGITETTVHSTYEILATDDVYLSKDIPIGKPLPGIKIYIVDSDLNVVPTGVMGEIFIAGRGVCQGYCNLPELTAEKFIQSSTLPEKRLYRSGDLGKWQSDGSIQYCGRSDRQLKVRGHRIELGEIEAALCRYPGISKVVSRTIGDGATLAIVAYYVSGPEVGSQKLRTFLQGQLPNYMVPNFFVHLERVPLSLNGKVDWHRIPIPTVESKKAASHKSEPRNEIERNLLKAWKKVLDSQNIGIKDNFFEIGGDSIEALKISALMHANHYKLEIKDFFLNPTIELLSPLVKRIDSFSDQLLTEGRIPLLPIQEYYFNSKDLRASQFTQSYSWIFEQRISIEALEKALHHLYKHHDGLRVTFVERENAVEQINHAQDYADPVLLFEWSLESNTIERIENEISRIRNSIDISTGPLIKVAIFRLAEYDQVVFIIHHLVVDWVSWNIILVDFHTLYHQITNNLDITLPTKTTSLKRWSEEVVRMANGNEILSDLNYWSEVSNQVIAPLFKSENESATLFEDTEMVSFKISDNDTRLLLTESNSPFKTNTNDLVITALGLTLHEVFFSSKIMLTVEAHGRESIVRSVNISRTVGWFTALYPLVIDFSYTHNLSRQIKEVKETIRRVPNNGITYGMLRYKRHLVDKQRLNLNPQVSFNYLGKLPEALNGGDADIEMNFTPARRSEPGKYRLTDLDVTVFVDNEQLTVSVAFGSQRIKSARIVELCEVFRQNILRVIHYTAERKSLDLTPSDLIYNQLSIEDLDEFFK